MNISSTRTRPGAAILFSGVLVLSGLALTGEATAGEDVEGNPTCSGLGYEYSHKEDPPRSTTVDRDGMTATFTIGTHPDQTDPNDNNAIVDYDIETTATEYAIVVKASDGATVYRSDDDGNLEAPPLHAPANSSGKWPEISHFQLCWNEPVPPPPPPPPPEPGQVDVEKVVTGEGAPDADEYTICLRGPTASDQPTCTTITGATTATFDDLVPGTYTVTEDDPGADYEVTITDATVEVTSGGAATATVTNEFVQQQSFPPTVPETPTTPETPRVPDTPTTPETPTAPETPMVPETSADEAATQATLPATGGEGGIAAIAAVVLASGMALTLLSRRREAQRT